MAHDVEQIFSRFGPILEQLVVGHYHADLRITDEEAAAGAERTVGYQRRLPCPACSGKGTATGREAMGCSTCGATGVRHRTEGFLVYAERCPSCRGRGKHMTDPCLGCDGVGARDVATTATVTIPPGTAHGTRVVIAGAGTRTHGGAIGDLTVYVMVGDRPDNRAAEAEAAAMEEMMKMPPVHPPPRTTLAGVISLVAIVLFVILAIAVR